MAGGGCPLSGQLAQAMEGALRDGGSLAAKCLTDGRLTRTSLPPP